MNPYKDDDELARVRYQAEVDRRVDADYRQPQESTKAMNVVAFRLNAPTGLASLSFPRGIS